MSKSVYKLTLLLFSIFLFSVQSFAEDDPNPDSPVPVLLSQTGSSQILAVDGTKWDGTFPKSSQIVFRPGQKNLLTLFVTNLDLMQGEGSNALRVYLYQKSRKVFELQTETLTQLNKTVYALKVRIYDRDGYRGPQLPVVRGKGLEPSRLPTRS